MSIIRKKIMKSVQKSVRIEHIIVKKEIGK